MKYRYKWVRPSTGSVMWHDDWPGEAGWELVPPEDHPDAVLATDSYVGRLREKALRELFGSFNIDIGELG